MSFFWLIEPDGLGGRQMRQGSVVLLLVLFLCLPARAAYGAEQRPMHDLPKELCENADDDVLADLLAEVRKVRAQIPGIPAEEAHYLESEFAAVMKLWPMADEEARGQLAIRYEKILARPWYSIWNARNELDTVQKDLEWIVKAPNPFSSKYENREAEKLSRAISASASLARYTNAVGDFVAEAQRGRVKAVRLSKRQIGELSFHNGFLPSVLGAYMQCKLAKVMGPQPILPHGGAEGAKAGR
jgi:hypothetical protein